MSCNVKNTKNTEAEKPWLCTAATYPRLYHPGKRLTYILRAPDRKTAEIRTAMVTGLPVISAVPAGNNDAKIAPGRGFVCIKTEKRVKTEDGTINAVIYRFAASGREKRNINKNKKWRTKSNERKVDKRKV